ncbi:MAG: hypothetical protein QM648_03160 [Solirubrobacterales bacterium]
MNVALRLWDPNLAVSPVHWLVPLMQIVLLAALLIDNPINGVKFPVVRKVQLAIAGGLVLVTLWATGTLVVDLVSGSALSNQADELLAVGAVVWLGNIYAFSILYWLTDGGGPVRRGETAVPIDFAFIQQQESELKSDSWRSQYLDYLHLAFTNATAFSPTDVMPLSHRAKFTMVLQSTVALALVALVVARSVNAFT